MRRPSIASVVATGLLPGVAQGQAFERPHAASPSNVALLGLTAVDLDGDDDLELVGVDSIPSGSGSGLVVLENDGSGRGQRRGRGNPRKDQPRARSSDS